MVSTNSEQAQLVEFVREWAEVNTDGILDQKTKIFSVPEIEGVIGYRIVFGNAVVLGDPLCAPENQIALAKEFENYCRSQKLRVVYAMATEKFAHLAVETFPFFAIQFGTKYLLDPFQYAANKTTLLRKKIRQSTRNGVEVFEYRGDDPALEQAMNQVAIDWVGARKGIQFFLANPVIFAHRQGKKWFYAQYQGKIIGIALLNELKAHQGWLLSNVMVLKGSPSGVSEHLVMSAMEALEKEGCHFVIFGPEPAKELEFIGLGKILPAIIRASYKFVKKVGRLNGHDIYWDKFEPTYRSSYLLFPKKRFSITNIIAVLRALNLSIK